LYMPVNSQGECNNNPEPVCSSLLGPNLPRYTGAYPAHLIQKISVEKTENKAETMRTVNISKAKGGGGVRKFPNVCLKVQKRPDHPPPPCRVPVRNI
jgi:hypothetical protein